MGEDEGVGKMDLEERKVVLLEPMGVFILANEDQAHQTAVLQTIHGA